MDILLTGLGSIGRRHARLLREYDESITLSAYRSGTTAAGNELNIPEYTDLEEALAADPDVVFVTNPTHLHVETALRCARSDCDLFIEKPLSHSLQSVDRLIEEVRDRNLVAQMGCQLRFDPVLRNVNSMLESGTLGQPVSFRIYSGSYLPDWRDGTDYRDSYSADPEMGGGVVLDLVHELDYAYWMFGEPSSVDAQIGNVDYLDIDSESIAEILLRTADDVVGNIHLDYCRRQPRRDVEVICERGTILGDVRNGELIVEHPSQTDRTSFDHGRDKRFLEQLETFIENVKRRETPENDVRVGKDVLEIALTIKQNQVDE